MIWPVAVICAVLLAVALRAPAARRRPYLVGTLTTALVFVVITPFVEVLGTHVLWTGPTIPVLGTLDVTTEELRNGLFQGLRPPAGPPPLPPPTPRPHPPRPP